MRLLSPAPALSSLATLCCCTAAVLAGCKPASRAGGAAMDTTAAAPAAAESAAAPAARKLSLADLAGKWNMRSIPASGRDTTATTYVLTATADSTGWTITFPNRKPIPSRILMVSGDSIVSEAGPYESARRKGVQVRTHTVMRREGDRLVGTTVAHYTTKRADSVLTLRTEGTKASGGAAAR